MISHWARTTGPAGVEMTAPVARNGGIASPMVVALSPPTGSRPGSVSTRKQLSAPDDSSQIAPPPASAGRNARPASGFVIARSSSPSAQVHVSGTDDPEGDPDRGRKLGVDPPSRRPSMAVSPTGPGLPAGSGLTRRLPFSRVNHSPGPGLGSNREGLRPAITRPSNATQSGANPPLASHDEHGAKVWSSWFRPPCSLS